MEPEPSLGMIFRSEGPCLKGIDLTFFSNDLFSRFPRTVSRLSFDTNEQRTGILALLILKLSDKLEGVQRHDSIVMISRRQERSGVVRRRVP